MRRTRKSSITNAFCHGEMTREVSERDKSVGKIIGYITDF